MRIEGRTKVEETENDDLVDVAEWAEVQGLALQLPFPTALTADLWDLMLEVPFGLVGEHHTQQRLLGVLGAATRALLYALRVLRADPREGFAVSFAAPLPCRSSEPKWRPLELRCGPDDTGETVLTIALAGGAKALVPVHRQSARETASARLG